MSTDHPALAARAAPDGLLLVEDGTIVWANAAAHRITRWERLEGTTVADILAPESTAHLELQLSSAEAGEVVRVLVRTVGSADRIAVDIRTGESEGARRVLVLREAASIEGIVSRERMRAVGEMARVLAHEVRNPLGVVFNVLGGLRRSAGKDEASRRLLDILGEEADRLKRLMAELVDYARPTTPFRQRQSLSEALAGLVLEPAGDPDRPSADVRWDLPATLPEVIIDVGLLRRAVTCLLENAVEHAPLGGYVDVVARPVGGEVRLTIANDGDPIPAELQPRLFEPFFTTRAQGTGLGLAIARRSLQDFGGRVEHDAEAERTTFRIWLPTAEGGAS